jgi:3-oxoacyl-[acyl-carrier-protein] synthase-3
VTALDAVAAYVPATRIPIDDLADRLELSDGQVKVFRRFHGLDVVRRDPGGSVLDLLTAAVGELTQLRGQEHRVRYVLYARSMPVTVPYPCNPLHDLCHAVGLGHAMAFTVTHHACATGLLAIDIAGRLLATDGEPGALALVLAGEKTFTKEADLVPETAIFGEGAAACLVSSDGRRNRLLSYVSRVRGEFDGRMMDDPALLSRFQREYPDALAEVILAAVERAGITMADVRVILPHNVNLLSWKRMSKRLSFPVDRIVLDNVAVTGHNFSADAFINYDTAIRRGLLDAGEPYLLAAAGLGATFSAMVLQH